MGWRRSGAEAPGSPRRAQPNAGRDGQTIPDPDGARTNGPDTFDRRNFGDLDHFGQRIRIRLAGSEATDLYDFPKEFLVCLVVLESELIIAK